MRLRYEMLFLSLFLSCFLLLFFPMAASGGEVDRELLKSLLESNRKNRDQITSGTGQGIIRYHREVSPDGPAAGQVLKDPKNSGIKIAECQWYLLGDRVRSDMKYRAPNKGEKIMGGEFRPFEQREAWTPDYAVEYRQFEKTADAYLRKPRAEPSGECSLGFVQGAAWGFDPRQIFEIDNELLENWLEEYEEFGLFITAVEEEGPAGHKRYTIKKEAPAGGVGYLLVIVIAEDQGFNVVSLECRSGNDGDDDGVATWSFQAAYDDGGTGGKVFYPKTYRYKSSNIVMTEELTVEFTKLQLNLPPGRIDEHVFTLGGLGIPKGTSFYDMRSGERNPPTRKYYVGIEADLDPPIDMTPKATILPDKTVPQKK